MKQGVSFQSGATLVPNVDTKVNYTLTDAEILLDQQFFYDLDSHLMLPS